MVATGVEKGNEQEAADEAEVQQQAQEDQDSAVWRITDGKGAAPDVAATTPAANRMAAGRLDFVLQVMASLLKTAGSRLRCFCIQTQTSNVNADLWLSRHSTSH